VQRRLSPEDTEGAEGFADFGLEIGAGPSGFTLTIKNAKQGFFPAFCALSAVHDLALLAKLHTIR